MIFQKCAIRNADSQIYLSKVKMWFLIVAIAIPVPGCGLLYETARRTAADSEKEEPVRRHTSEESTRRSGYISTPQQPVVYGHWKEKAEAAYAEGDYVNAAHYFQKAEASTGGTLATVMAVRRGDCMLKLGELSEAKGEYKKGVDRRGKPTVEGACLGLARVGLAKFRKRMDWPNLYYFERLLKLVEKEEALRPGRPEVAACQKEIEELILKRKEIGEKARARRRQLYEEERRRRAEADVRLESQVKRVGRLQCRPVLFRVYIDIIRAGGRVDRWNSAVGVVVGCKNRSGKTERISASNVTLIDSAGGQYDLETESGYAHSLEGETDKELVFIRKFVNIRPRSEVFLGLFFDPKEGLLGDEFKLDLKGTQFELVR